MKGLGIFLSFVFIMLIGFFLVGFTDSMDAPTSGDALNQYNNLTEAVSIANTGLNATMLVLIATMAFTAVLFMISTLTKRRT